MTELKAKLKRAVRKAKPYLKVMEGKYTPNLKRAEAHFDEYTGFISKNSPTPYGMDEQERIVSTISYDRDRGILVDYFGNPANVDNRIYNVTKEGYLITQPDGIHGTFHHSSITQTQSVVCAGYISIRDGKIIKMDTNSGHYQPTDLNLYNAVTVLSSYGEGVFSEDAKIFPFSSPGKTVEEFKSSFEEIIETEHGLMTRADSLRLQDLEANKRWLIQDIEIRGDTLENAIEAIDVLAARGSKVNFIMDIAILPPAIQATYSAQVGVTLDKLRIARISPDMLVTVVAKAYESDMGKRDMLISKIASTGADIPVSQMDALPLSRENKEKFILNYIENKGVEAALKESSYYLRVNYAFLGEEFRTRLVDQIIGIDSVAAKNFMNDIYFYTGEKSDRILDYLLRPDNLDLLMKYSNRFRNIPKERREEVFEVISHSRSDNRLRVLTELAIMDEDLRGKYKNFLDEKAYSDREIELSSYSIFFQIYEATKIDRPDIASSIIDIVKTHPLCQTYMFVVNGDDRIKRELAQYFVSPEKIREGSEKVFRFSPDLFTEVLKEKPIEEAREITKSMIEVCPDFFSMGLSNLNESHQRFWEERIRENRDLVIEKFPKINQKTFFHKFSPELKREIYEKIFDTHEADVTKRIEIDRWNLESDLILKGVLERKILERSEGEVPESRKAFVSSILDLCDKGSLTLSEELTTRLMDEKASFSARVASSAAVTSEPIIAAGGRAREVLDRRRPVDVERVLSDRSKSVSRIMSSASAASGRGM